MINIPAALVTANAPASDVNVKRSQRI